MRDPVASHHAEEAHGRRDRAGLRQVTAKDKTERAASRSSRSRTPSRRSSSAARRRSRAARQGASRKGLRSVAPRRPSQRQRDSVMASARRTSCASWWRPTSRRADSTSRTSRTSSTTTSRTTPRRTSTAPAARAARAHGPRDHLRKRRRRWRTSRRNERAAKDGDRRMGAARGAPQARAATPPARPLGRATGPSARSARSSRALKHLHAADEVGGTDEPVDLAANGAKLFVNRGSGSGASTVDDLHWALTEGAVIPEGEIKRIEVL